MNLEKEVSELLKNLQMGAGEGQLAAARAANPMPDAREPGKETFQTPAADPFADSVFTVVQPAQAQNPLGERRRKRYRAFCALCPPLYRQSDKSRLGPFYASVVKPWKPGPMGIGLCGFTQKMKTRMIWALLRRLVLGGIVRARDVYAIRGFQFGLAVQKQWEHPDLEKVIQRARKAPILFLDEFGKQKFTDAVQAEIFDLIEDRAAHQRPLLWTSNLDSRELESVLDPNYTEPFIRRLREFTEIHVVQ